MANGPRLSHRRSRRRGGSTAPPGRPLRRPGHRKTTFASQAPSPIFLCVEDGAGFIDGKAFPSRSLARVFEAIESLLRDEHRSRRWSSTPSMPSSRSAGNMSAARRAGANTARSRTSATAALPASVEAWEDLSSAWRAATPPRHAPDPDRACGLQGPQDPDHEAWRRWDLKLPREERRHHLRLGGCGALRRPEMVAKKDGLKTRGFATGERLLHTAAAGAHNGANRYGLPEVFALEWGPSGTRCSRARPPPSPRPGGLEAQAREVRRLRTDLNTPDPQLPLEQRERAALRPRPRAMTWPSSARSTRRVDELTKPAPLALGHAAGASQAPRSLPPPDPDHEKDLNSCSPSRYVSRQSRRLWNRRHKHKRARRSSASPSGCSRAGTRPRGRLDRPRHARDRVVAKDMTLGFEGNELEVLPSPTEQEVAQLLPATSRSWSSTKSAAGSLRRRKWINPEERGR